MDSENNQVGKDPFEGMYGKLVRHGYELHDGEVYLPWVELQINDHISKLWGDDLKRSITESGAKIGDLVVLIPDVRELDDPLRTSEPSTWSRWTTHIRPDLELRNESHIDPLPVIPQATIPPSLLKGKLVRDNEGAYRAKNGDAALMVVDKGQTLSFKRGPDNAKAAVELAMSKGWTAISLSGNPEHQEAVWLAASFAGLQVVHYEPSKETLAKLKNMFDHEANDMHIADESNQQQPTAPKSEKTITSGAFVGPIVADGIYSGPIVASKDGFVAQKIGRAADAVVWHDVTKLVGWQVKEFGEAPDIQYANGVGIVKMPERAMDRGR